MFFFFFLTEQKHTWLRHGRGITQNRGQVLSGSWAQRKLWQSLVATEVESSCFYSKGTTQSVVLGSGALCLLEVVRKAEILSPPHTCCCCLVAKSRIWLFVTPQTIYPSRLLCLWVFPGRNTGLGCHFLLQGTFPIQGWSLYLLLGR